MASSDPQLSQFTNDLRSSLSELISSPPSSTELSPDLESALQTHILAPLSSEFEQVIGHIEQTVNGFTFDLQQKCKELQRSQEEFQRKAEIDMSALRNEQSSHLEKIREMRKAVEGKMPPAGVDPELARRADKIKADIDGFHAQLSDIERRVRPVIITSIKRQSAAQVQVELENQKAVRFERLQLVFEGEVSESAVVETNKDVGGSEKIAVDAEIPMMARQGGRWMVMAAAAGKQVSNLVALP